MFDIASTFCVTILPLDTASQVAAAILLQVSVALAGRATPSTIYSAAQLSTPDFLEAQSCDDSTCQHRTMSTSRHSPSNDVEKLTLDEKRRQRLEQQIYIRLCATPPYFYPRQTVFLASNIRVYQILRGRFCLQVVLSNTSFMSVSHGHNSTAIAFSARTHHASHTFTRITVH